MEKIHPNGWNLPNGWNHPKQGFLYGEQYTWGEVVILQARGELGGPGDLVIQDRLVANTQRSTGLNLGRLSRHESPGTFSSSLEIVKDVCWFYSQMLLKEAP